MTLTVEHHDPSNHGSVIEGGTNVFTGPLSDCWAYVQIKEREAARELPQETVVTKFLAELEDSAVIHTVPMGNGQWEGKASVYLDDVEEAAGRLLTSQPHPLKTSDSPEVVGPDWSQAPEWAKAWVVNRNGFASWVDWVPTLVDFGWDGFERHEVIGRVNHPNWPESLTKRPEVDDNCPRCGGKGQIIHGSGPDRIGCCIEGCGFCNGTGKQGFQRLKADEVPVGEAGIPVTEQNQELMVPLTALNDLLRDTASQYCDEPHKDVVSECCSYLTIAVGQLVVQGRKPSGSYPDADTGSEGLGVPGRPAAIQMAYQEAISAIQQCRDFFAEYNQLLDEREERLKAMLAARDQGGE